MIVKIIDATVAVGQPVAAGEIVEVEEGAARVLIAGGKAVHTGPVPEPTGALHRVELGVQAVHLDPGKEVLHPGPRLVDDALLARLWGRPYVFVNES